MGILKNFSYFRFTLLTLITLNIILLNYLKMSYYSQIINLLISYGIYDFYNNVEFKVEKKVNIFKTILAFSLLIITLYRSFWLHINDNFIFLFFPLLLISLDLFFNNIFNTINNLKPILMALLFPIGKLLFIPLSIVLTPFSTLFTWITLNALGFYSVMSGQEIFFSNSGINITFSCSGAGQIIFSFTAMLIFNFCFPLKNRKFLLIQLFRTFLFTFSINIIRLFLLTIFVNTAGRVDDFSIFDYLHGGNGGLFFTFFSILISCESYKRIYFRNI